MKKLLFIVLLLSALPAFAQASQSVAYTWQAPTTRADGTALPISQLSGYELSYTIDGGTSTVVPITGGSATSSTVMFSLAPKAAPYVLVSSLRAIDTGGLKSAPAIVTTNLTVTAAVPGAPAVFKLSITCTSGACSLVVN